MPRTLIASRPGRIVLFVAVAAALGLVLAPLGAEESLPADKTTVAGSSVEVVAPGESVTLLEARMRTSSPADLVLAVTAECALTTNLTTVGNDMSRAFGQVVVWVEIDGAAVPVSPGDEDGGVVFCNRAYQRETLQFDDEDATIRTFYDSRQANGFNWMALDVGSGIHTLTVKGSLTTEATENATAMAAVGNRTLVVSPTHAAPGETLG